MPTFDLPTERRLELRRLLEDPDTLEEVFWDSYRQLAIMTASANNPHTGAPFSYQAHYDHAVIGFVTELGELLDICKKFLFYGKPYDVPHIVEELGDGLWYTALQISAAQTTDFRMPRSEDSYDIVALTSSVPHVELLMQLALGGSHGLDRLWQQIALTRIYISFTKAGLHLPSWREIAITNIRKLHDARYKDGEFSSEQAINRNLDEEAKQLRQDHDTDNPENLLSDEDLDTDNN